MEILLLDSSVAASSISSMTSVLEEMLGMGTTLIQWCLTTFPVNVGLAAFVIYKVMGIIRGAKNTVGK